MVAGPILRYNAVKPTGTPNMRRNASSTRRLARTRDPRRAILDATEALLVAEGYECFSIRKLVSRCGYTAPTIYHYFGDKQGLIDALLEERFGRLLRQLRRVRRGDEPVSYLRALAEAFVRFGLRNPTHYRLVMTPRPDGSEPPRTAEEARAAFSAPLEELAERGLLRHGDFEAALQSLWALLHGQISLRIVRPDYEWSPSLLDVSLDAMLQGLLRSAERSTATAAAAGGRS